MKLKFLSRPLPIKIAIILALIGTGFLVYTKLVSQSQQEPQYQTETVQQGTLVTSISGTGSITSSNYTNITTKTSGVVKKVYVTNGDTVTKGQKIAEITLDDYAKERQSAAWVAYLESLEAVKDAQTAKVTADITMWQAREDYLDAQEDVDNNKGDTEGEKQVVIKTEEQTRLDFEASELKYKNADADLANARAKVSAALRNYQENSATIIAPSDGQISNLSLAEGVTVAANSSTSSTSGATIVSAQTVGKVEDPSGQLIATVDLTEIDIISVKADQKVTLTLDAYPDKTLTGRVLAVNTSGSINSGVTTYPVTILIDPTSLDIYPNMAVSADIIVSSKTDVLLVSSSAIQTDESGTSYLRVMKDGQISYQTIEVGESNDIQTEVISGLKDGDEIVVGSSTASTITNGNSTASPFSGSGFGGGMMGGIGGR